MLKSSGEELLIENGIFERRSSARREILGCIGCRWNVTRERKETPAFYGYEVIKCSGVSPGSIYPVLDRLEETGIIVSQLEVMGDGFRGRPPRKIYYPNNTELGMQFDNALGERIKPCGLETTSE